MLSCELQYFFDEIPRGKPTGYQVFGKNPIRDRPPEAESIGEIKFL